MIPAITAVVRALMRVSPWKMWLYSCAITPCSSSRESRSMQPRVTPITERDGSGPAANALTEWSSSRYTGGTGTPDAIDISSTIFRSSRSLGSRVAGSIGRPPSISAIFAPPCESCASLTSVATCTVRRTLVPFMFSSAFSTSSGLTKKQSIFFGGIFLVNSNFIPAASKMRTTG